MTITSTEFKNDLNKYLQLSQSEDIFITINGRVMCKITAVNEDKNAILKSLIGSLPERSSIEEGREERLKKHEMFDWYRCSWKLRAISIDSKS